MDLTVSPDLESFVCYSIVFLLGLLAAKSQVGQRLGTLPGQWIMVNTWLLFFAYAALPVGLFWFLDRTNAIHDTSLFAAIIVGIGYQQILSGGIGTVRAPGEVSKLWQPFAAWADRISDRIRDRVALNDSRFDEQVLAVIRSDAAKLDHLQELVLAHAATPADILAKLVDIDTQAGAIGSEAAVARKTEFLYRSLKMSSPKMFGYLLYRKGLIPGKWYFWYDREWRSKTTAIVIGVALLTMVGVGVHEAQKPQNRALYYVWRLRKDSTTDYDRFRARTKLKNYLDRETYEQLAYALRTPNLSAKNADNILALYLETRNTQAAQQADTWHLLIDSLRTENSDTRLRIYKELVYIGVEHKMDPKQMQDWQPDPKDSAIRIDEMIKQWNEVKLQ